MVRLQHNQTGPMYQIVNVLLGEILLRNDAVQHMRCRHLAHALRFAAFQQCRANRSVWTRRTAAVMIDRFRQRCTAECAAHTIREHTLRDSRSIVGSGRPAVCFVWRCVWRWKRANFAHIVDGIVGELIAQQNEIALIVAIGVDFFHCAISVTMKITCVENRTYKQKYIYTILPQIEQKATLGVSTRFRHHHLVEV